MVLSASKMQLIPNLSKWKLSLIFWRKASRKAHDEDDKRVLGGGEVGNINSMSKLAAA